jgi:hypothetical protein
MSDLFFMLAGIVMIVSIVAIGHWVEYRDRCRHKWAKWDDPENTGLNVIQRRACEKCNMEEARVVIPNASLEFCEERHDVAISTPPTDTVDQKAGA